VLVHEDILAAPGPVVVAGVSHVPIIIVIPGAIPFGVTMSPVMITVTLIVIAIAIAEGDATEVDADDGAGGCGVRECGGQDDQRRGQNGPFEQFDAGLPLRDALGATTELTTVSFR
jgi:hypothetical protein